MLNDDFTLAKPAPVRNNADQMSGNISGMLRAPAALVAQESQGPARGVQSIRVLDRCPVIGRYILERRALVPGSGQRVRRALIGLPIS